MSADKPRAWDAAQAFLRKLHAERRRERDAVRAAECAEWYVAPDVVPTSGEAKIMVASLLGSIRIEWQRGAR
ncbi:MAG: hypothetical protein ABL977_10780 [Candidatus Eisenbacteria bacterium]